MDKSSIDRSIIVSRSHPAEKQALAEQMRREMTPAEALLWQRLRRSQLNNLHFRRQQIIDGFIVDFYCHSARLIVEADGGVHAGQAEYDQERSRILCARGLRVMRFENERILQDVETVLTEIADAAQSASDSPS